MNWQQYTELQHHCYTKILTKLIRIDYAELVSMRISLAIQTRERHESVFLCQRQDRHRELKDWILYDEHLRSNTDIRIERISNRIRIHNVYNFLFVSYSLRDNFLTLSKTNCSLIDKTSKHHVLLRDFNLHHSFWSDFSRSTQHAAANEFLNLIKEHDLSLTLSREFITWETRNIFNIIDLTFMTSYLIEKIEHCMIRSNIRQSSNHISISTRILLEMKTNSMKLIKRRFWKLLNMSKMKEIEKNALTLKSLTIVVEIDAYTKKI